MVVYWTIAILTVLISLSPVKTQKGYFFRLIVSLIPLFLYGAFRVNYGLDYGGYEDFFNSVKILGIGSDERMELGYYYLNKTLPSFRSLLIVQTILLCVAYFFLFKLYIPSKYAWLGFVILFLNGPLTVFFMLSGIRNGIAISIFIISTYFINKRKFVPFAILIFISYWFHNSVVLFAPIAYFVANGKPITTRSIVLWLSVMVFIGIASSTIIHDYVSIFINSYFERYSSYVELAEEHGKGSGILVSLFSIVSAFLFLLALKDKYMSKTNNQLALDKIFQSALIDEKMVAKKNLVYLSLLAGKNGRDKEMTVNKNMIIKLSLLFFLSFLLGPLNMRMSHYYASFFVAGSVMITYSGTNKYLKSAYIIAILAYLIYSLILWFNNPYFSYDTYQSVLFNWV